MNVTLFSLSKVKNTAIAAYCSGGNSGSASDLN